MKNSSILYKTGLMICFFIPLSLFSQNQNTAQKKDSIEYEFTGTIISKIGNIVKVQQSDTSKLPGVGTAGTFSKYFEKVFLGMNTKGWLETGNMKIKSVEKNIVTMELLEEKSIITVNGQKEDHFKAGFVVKFCWKE